MAYSKSVYDRAMEIIGQRRRKAEDERQERHDKCVLLCPEIALEEEKMKKSVLELPGALGMKDRAKSYVEELARKNLQAQENIKKLLVSRKIPDDFLEIRYTCEKCGDTGFADGKRCDCLKQLMREISYNALSDKLPIRECTFDNFDVNYYPPDYDSKLRLDKRLHMTKVFEFCRNYAETFFRNSESLIFMGETGLGKTHLSLAIAGRVTEKGFGVVYGSAQNILSSLENEKFGKQPSESSPEKSVLSCDLLILDDMGAEFVTQFTVSALYNIINTRLMEKKPTIISTNLSPREMEEKYSRRITSRIFGNYRAVGFFGKDIRQLKSN